MKGSFNYKNFAIGFIFLMACWIDHSRSNGSMLNLPAIKMFICGAWAFKLCSHQFFNVNSLFFRFLWRHGPSSTSLALGWAVGWSNLQQRKCQHVTGENFYILHVQTSLVYTSWQYSCGVQYSSPSILRPSMWPRKYGLILQVLK